MMKVTTQLTQKHHLIIIRITVVEILVALIVAVAIVVENEKRKYSFICTPFF
jgi:hypothetical protein